MTEAELLAAGYHRLAPMSVYSDWSFRLPGKPWRVDSRRKRLWRDACFVLYVLRESGWDLVGGVSELSVEDITERATGVKHD